MITAYLKATNYCNVGCSHCYLTEEVRADRMKMTPEIMAATGKLLEQMRIAQGQDSVHIIWHGGEPLMLKPDYYEEAGKILDQYIPGHTESLQSSLVPLTPIHLPWIKNRLGGAIGTSMDFSARTHKGSAEEYQRRFMKNVELCREHDIFVIPGVTPAQPEMKKAKELVQWMDDRGFERFNIERYNSFGFNAPMLPSNREHSDFLTDLFVELMHRMEKTGKAPMVRVIAAALNGVLFEQPGDRWGGTCQSDFIVIEPDGSLNNCPDKTSKEAPYSNALSGFEAFQRSAPRRKWIRIQAIDHRKDHCRTCENNTWCKSGCPITCNDKVNPDDECAGYRTFLSFVRETVDHEAGRALAMAYLAAFEGQRARANDPDMV